MTSITLILRKNLIKQLTVKDRSLSAPLNNHLLPLEMYKRLKTIREVYNA